MAELEGLCVIAKLSDCGTLHVLRTIYRWPMEFQGFRTICAPAKEIDKIDYEFLLLGSDLALLEMSGNTPTDIRGNRTRSC